MSQQNRKAVYVKHLPTVSKARIHELFDSYGRINVRILNNNESTKKDVMVEFENEEIAQRAKHEMNGKIIDENKLVIEFATTTILTTNHSSSNRTKLSISERIIKQGNQRNDQERPLEIFHANREGQSIQERITLPRDEKSRDDGPRAHILDRVNSQQEEEHRILHIVKPNQEKQRPIEIIKNNPSPDQALFEKNDAKLPKPEPEKPPVLTKNDSAVSVEKAVSSNDLSLKKYSSLDESAFKVLPIQSLDSTSSTSKIRSPPPLVIQRSESKRIYRRSSRSSSRTSRYRRSRSNTRSGSRSHHRRESSEDKRRYRRNSYSKSRSRSKDRRSRSPRKRDQDRFRKDYSGKVNNNRRENSYSRAGSGYRDRDRDYERDSYSRNSFDDREKDRYRDRSRTNSRGRYRKNEDSSRLYQRDIPKYETQKEPVEQKSQNGLGNRMNQYRESTPSFEQKWNTVPNYQFQPNLMSNGYSPALSYQLPNYYPSYNTQPQPTQNGIQSNIGMQPVLNYSNNMMYMPQSMNVNPNINQYQNPTPQVSYLNMGLNTVPNYMPQNESKIKEEIYSGYSRTVNLEKGNTLPKPNSEIKTETIKEERIEVEPVLSKAEQLLKKIPVKQLTLLYRYFSDGGTNEELNEFLSTFNDQKQEDVSN